MAVSRRGAVAGALALAACGRGPASSQPAAKPEPPPPLKAGAISPVGCAIMTPGFDDPTYRPLIARHFSQATADWEMKMEYIARDDGSYRWDAPDRIADFLRANGMRLHGHTLVWYAQEMPAFTRLDGQGATFARAYDGYIRAVAGRYRGLARSWDVVNEAVNEDGSGLREHLWSRNLGEIDHMVRAFDVAAEADPDATLFINEYFLERIPRKRAEFMRLVERLLKAGAKLGGIGCQSHMDLDLPTGASRAAIRDLASFGLPIHISELDISFQVERPDPRSRAEKQDAQATLAREVAEAYAELPARQRFAFSTWGLRDKDSWLRKPPNAGDGTDSPLMFDDDGVAKPMFDAVAAALKP